MMVPLRTLIGRRMRPVAARFQEFCRKAGSLGQKDAPDRSGAKLERDTMNAERPAGTGLSAVFPLHFDGLLAACLLVKVFANRREQPWTAARLGGVLCPLGLHLPVLGIGWSIRHVSLGDH